MATNRPKNQPPKANGRPRLPQLSERQSAMRTELLNVVKPYFKAALKEIAKIGGLEVDKQEVSPSLEIEDASKPKKELVPANTRLSACKAITDMYQSSLKEVYLKDDTTPAKVEEPEQVIKPTNVSRLSLHVVNDNKELV